MRLWERMIERLTHRELNTQSEGEKLVLHLQFNAPLCTSCSEDKIVGEKVGCKRTKGGGTEGNERRLKAEEQQKKKIKRELMHLWHGLTAQKSQSE